MNQRSISQDLMVYALEWGSPYTRPPDNLPRTIALEVSPRGSGCPALDALRTFPRFAFGTGWAISCRVLNTKPPRRLSEQAKQSIRRKALVRRVNKQAPLFAESIIDSKLAAHPDYYGEEE